MAYIAPAIPDFKAQFVRDFPYAVPLLGGGSGAVLTVTNQGPNQSLDTVALVAGGANYPKKPSVIVYGGGGIGAEIGITLTAGVISAPTIIKGGYGFGVLPTVYISNGKGDNTDPEKVTDYDIVRAFGLALNFNFSNGLFASQAAFTAAVNLLSAHYLCETLQAAGTGLGGKSEWLTQAKTVGNVTESYQIPDRIMRSPFLSKLSKTTYGAQFLELVSPLLIGNVHVMHGMTLP